MPTTIEIAGLALALVAGWCLLALRKARVSKKDPRMLVLGMLVEPGRSRWVLLTLTAAIWACISLLLNGLIRSTSWVTLVIVGLLLGAAGGAQLALGASLAFSFISPSPDLLLAWAVPLTAGALIRLLHYNPMRWRPPLTWLPRMERYGPIVPPPLPADWLWLAIGVGTVVTPLVAVALTSHGPDIALRAACAILVSAQLAIVNIAVQGRHRWVRRIVRGCLLVAIITVALVSRGSVGEWLAQHWTGSHLATGVLGGALLSAVALLSWSMRHVDSMLVRLAGMLVRSLTGLGLGPFWVIAVFHPAHQTLVAATILITAEFGLVLFLRWQTDLSLLPLLEQRAYNNTISWNASTRLSMLGPWLYDGFLRHPGRFDYTPVHLYLGMAVRGVRGRAAPGQGFQLRDPSAGEPLTGISAMRWIEAADQCLNLIDAEIETRLPVTLRDDLKRHQDGARADFSLTKAIVLGHVGQWIEAANSWRDAATRYRSAGNVTGEALARTGAAWVLATRIERPDAASRELARIDATRQSGALARWVYIVTAVTKLTTGDDTSATELLAQARAHAESLADDSLHAEVVDDLNESIVSSEANLAAMLAHRLTPTSIPSMV